jgi:hypothetical protein
VKRRKKNPLPFGLSSTEALAIGAGVGLVGLGIVAYAMSSPAAAAATTPSTAGASSLVPVAVPSTVTIGMTPAAGNANAPQISDAQAVLAQDGLSATSVTQTSTSPAVFQATGVTGTTAPSGDNTTVTTPNGAFTASVTYGA